MSAPFPRFVLSQSFGPVFVHAEAGSGAADADDPTEWLGRPQGLRTYDVRVGIHLATRVHDGTDPVAATEDDHQERVDQEQQPGL